MQSPECCGWLLGCCYAAIRMLWWLIGSCYAATRMLWVVVRSLICSNKSIVGGC